MPATLPLITVPVVTIVPSTTYVGASFHYSDVSYTLPLGINRQAAINANERMVIKAEIALMKARKLILTQLNSLRNSAFVLNVPVSDFIDDITDKAVRLITENRTVRQAILSDTGLAIATYLVCSNDRFGYEAILHVQTFDGVIVMTESRSRNTASQIMFNGQVVYLNGLILT